MKNTILYTSLVLLILMIGSCTTPNIPDPDPEPDGNRMQDSPVETLWSAWLSKDTSYFYGNSAGFLYKEKYVFVANINSYEENKTLMAYDRNTGEMLDSIPLLGSRVVNSALVGNRLMLNHDKNVLQCFDLDKMEEAWLFNKPGYSLRFNNAIQDGVCYQVVYPNAPSSTTPALGYEIDIQSGKSDVIFSHYPNEGEYEVLPGSPLIEEGENGHRISYYSLARCQGGDCQVDFLAHDLESDEILWSVAGDPFLGFSTFAPINSGENILSLDRDHITLINKNTGAVVSRDSIPPGLYDAYPLVVDGYAYFKPLQSSLTKVNIETGKVEWAYTDKGKSAGAFPPRFLRMGNGLIYLTSGVEPPLKVFDQAGNRLYRAETPYLTYDDLKKTFPHFGYNYVAIDEAEGTFYYMDGWKMHRCKLF